MSTSDGGIHNLNTADRSVLCLSRSLRQAGYDGLADQMQVWLGGRIDVAALRATLARLNRAHPVVTARLCEPRRGPAHWRSRPGAECVLHEARLSDAGDEAVLRHTAGILAAAREPTETDAVAFHLLHLPDGRDVLLLQYDHCLMDINGTKLLLQEINRLWSADADPTAPPDGDEDGIRAYLRRFPLRRRLGAVCRLPHRTKVANRCDVVTLSDATAPTPGGTLRIALRELDEGQTDAFTKRMTRLCGFPSLSMAILASVFRALLRHTPRPLTEKSALFIHLGTNLRGRADRGPIFHNLSSLLPLLVRPEETDEREKLVQLLNRQMRERLAEGIDLGVLQWAWWLRHWPRLQQRPAWDVFFRASVDYGYMGVLSARGDRFCGAPVERIFPIARTYSPPGLSLAPSLCGGRLLLPALYVESTVPEARVRAFLDTVVADLVG